MVMEVRNRTRRANTMFIRTAIKARKESMLRMSCFMVKVLRLHYSLSCVHFRSCYDIPIKFKSLTALSFVKSYPNHTPK